MTERGHSLSAAKNHSPITFPSHPRGLLYRLWKAHPAHLADTDGRATYEKTDLLKRDLLMPLAFKPGRSGRSFRSLRAFPRPCAGSERGPLSCRSRRSRIGSDALNRSI